MKAARGRFLSLTLFAISLFGVAAALLGRRFPPPNTDEIFIVAHGKSLWHGQGSRYGLYDDVFAPSAYAMRDAFGQIIETTTNAWYGFWPGRGGSAVAGALALLMMTAWAARVGGRRMAGATLGLQLLNPLIWCVACLVRPEALFLLTTAGLLYFLDRLPKAWTWSPFAAGALSGTLFTVHPNALAVAPGLLAVYVCRQPSLKRLAAALGGAGATALVVALIAGLPKLYLVRHSLAVELLRPLIAQWPWSAASVITAIQGKLWMAQTLFLPADVARPWHAMLALRMAAGGVLFGMLGLLWRQNAGAFRQTLRPLLWGLGVTWAVMVLCVANREVLYQVHFEPFIAPLFAAVWIAPAPVAARLWMAMKISVAVLWILAGLLFGRVMLRTTAGSSSVDALSDALIARQPAAHARLLAPNIFWPRWSAGDFRDIGALNYSYFYTGRRDLREWLAPWRPDIIAVDEPTRQVFLRGAPELKTLQALLGDVRVTRQGSLETHLPTVGRLDLFYLEWPHVQP